MTRRDLKNVAASVRQRLLNRSRADGQDFQILLKHFAIERLLYRLSTSAYAERFVLKGAMLLTSWFEAPHRATRDLDLLGFGDPTPDAMVAAFKEILAIEVEDRGRLVLDHPELGHDLSRRLFEITDDIASFAWSDSEVQLLHRAFSSEMSREVRALAALEPFTCLLPSANAPRVA